MTWPIRLALLISGGGSTAKYIIDACHDGELKGFVKPMVVIASKDGIIGIEKALDAGIEENQIVVCGQQHYTTEELFGQALLETLQTRGVTHVGQYGWLPRTPKNVIVAYEGRIINQHNGPLDTGRPDFGGQGCYGLRTHCARIFFARKSGRVEDQFTEATTHMVTSEFDKGYVIGRRSIDILSEDNPFSLARAAIAAKRQLQVEVLKQFAEGTVAPQPREFALVLPAQYKLLAEAKQVAGMLFPKG